MIEAIVFDFDGVIANSNPIKRNSYFIIFSDVKGSKGPVEEAIKENPKKTRYGVIEAILKKLRERGLMQFDDLEVERDRYVSLYGETTERETTRVREIRGAEDALADLSKRYPLFILTSTIQESIDRVIESRNLKKYFRGVYGTNSTDFDKNQTLKRMAREHGFDPRKAVFVGDGKPDYECASYFGIPFIAIVNETNDFAINPDIKYRLQDLTQLVETINRIEAT